MIDIIERLRRYAGGMCISTPTEQEAADIIEGLRAELSIERQWVAEYRRQAVRLSDEIKAMKQQEPVAWRTFDGEGGYDYRSYEDNENYKLGWDARNPNHIGWVEPLYALPGAQSGPSVPEVTDAMAIAFHHALTDGSIGAREVEEIKDALRAALAAAPEAKP